MPAVSVIMPAYNAAGTIRASIDSILAQTCADFELIVTDDCSTDETPAILAACSDPRLRVFRQTVNQGVVAARNRCMAEARADAVAMLDSDDLSAPTRLARQLDYFARHPATVLLGTASRVLQDGQLGRMIHPAATTPGLIRWLLDVANPLVCSSVMFRASAARRLACFMRESFRYAEDYDLYMRMAALGDVARLDETLTIYRLHPGNMHKQHETQMAAQATRVLASDLSALFASEADAAARLLVLHLSAGQGVADRADLVQLCSVFDALNHAVLQAPGTDAATRDGLQRHAGVLWRRMQRATARLGRISLSEIRACRPISVRPDAAGDAWLLLDRVPGRRQARAGLRLFDRPSPAGPPRGRLFDIVYEPVPPAASDPPTLFVVVDTEAEFDWAKPFSRALTAITAMDNIGRGQAVFDIYGLRPIYVVDYPVASQARGIAPLAAILARGGCEIGAHLHPWTTPPFDEPVSVRNSYPGNLDSGLEERKLECLVGVIRRSFGIAPVFYKAGRYGFGAATPAALVRHGIRVDLSVLPGADLRAKGGPDFSRLRSIPYRIGTSGILTLPMTRETIGLAPALGRIGRWADRLHLPSVLARMGLAETIMLTPEGVTSAEQIRLVRVMLARGARSFVLHYHSPSLGAGHTPYAGDEAGVERLITRLRDVCRFFFEDLGGLPGNPQSLLRVLDTA